MHAIERNTDVDNIIKPILDSLKMKVYEDDKLVNACAVKAMNINEFTLSSKYFNGKIFDDFTNALSSDHIIFIEIDELSDKMSFLGQIDEV